MNHITNSGAADGSAVNRYSYAATVASLSVPLFGYADLPLLPGVTAAVFVGTVLATLAVDWTV